MAPIHLLTIACLLFAAGPSATPDDATERKGRLQEATVFGNLEPGCVPFAGDWLFSEEVARRVTAEPRLREYRRQREKISDTAEDHFTLARWCRKQGLVAERRAHLLVAAALDPNDPRPQRALGRSRYQGRWMTQEEYAQAKAEDRERLLSYRQWRRDLVELLRQLQKKNPQQHDAAEERFANLTDPLSIPALEEVFSLHSEAMARLAVRAIAGLSGNEATLSLIRHAVWSSWRPVRQEAVEALKGRNLYDCVPVLIEYLRPTRSRESWTRSDDGQVLRGLTFQDFTTNYIVTTGAIRLPAVSQAMARIDENNSRRVANAAVALATLTGADHGVDQTRWRRWWAAENDEFYDPLYDSEPQRETERYVFPPSNPECFVAGTPVWTRRGPVAIDQVQMGDLVLAQDPETGEFDYQPVVRRTVRPRTAIINLVIEGENLGASDGHPFWVPGRGWVKAKELAQGDSLRGNREMHVLAAATKGDDSLAYNLEVADLHTYFVGRNKVLVHDNTPVEPPLRLPDARTIRSPLGP